MNQQSIAFCMAVAVALVTVVGDYFLKKAGMQHPPKMSYLILGCAIYGITGLVWFHNMQFFKLAILGALFSVAMVLCMALLGFFLFQETLTKTEVVGILLGFISIFLLVRFN